MIIKTKQNLTCKEVEVLIQYPTMNKQVQELLAVIQGFDTQIKCKGENHEVLVNASHIFFIESVDKRTYVYLAQQVLSTEFRLYQLIQMLSPAGFIQISKSCLLNINALERIKPLTNSRMEATLKNGERLSVTRKYLGGIRQALQGGPQI